ncbi:MAG TPA: FCD domain-containing protein [Gaiellaceae bacterium]|nr:FCD domain-containing protein [Gaiellaceae bacterium]
MTDTQPQVESVFVPMARRENLSSRSATIIKRYLLSEPLNPGDRLPPERRLAEALNVSRTVLREAINQLVGEGLVQRDPSRSPTVADFDRARVAQELSMLSDHEPKIRELVELRVLVELGAIEAIVGRASDADLKEIEHWVLEGERRIAEDEPLSIADVRFHSALLRSLGNRSVDALLPLIEEHMRENLLIDPHELAGVITDDDHRVVEQHRQIFEAVKARDPEAAKQRMYEHLDPYLHPEKYRRDGTERLRTRS